MIQKATIKEFCKTLIKGGKLKTQDDLYGADGVIKQIQKGLYEALLEGELTLMTPWPYNKGMSLSQIAAQIQEVYQLELSEEQISKITDSVMEEVPKWHIRPLSSTSPII